MKFFIEVSVQSHLKANNQFVQRSLLLYQFDLPDTESLDDAFITIATPGENGGRLLIIRK